jgi:23S rRNA pseudouridine1911/1915/1917 synthase
MPHSIEILVPPGKVRERIDVFLTHHIENATRSKVQQAIEQGHVLVDGTPRKASYRISPGERVSVTLPKAPPPDVTAENIPLDILFEDDRLLVVNKPAGMVTHPAHANYAGTLVNALLYHCNGNLSTLNEATRPGIVHRLDKDTSGIMVVAKDDAAHVNLAKQFSSRTIDREYWAVVWGLFAGGRKRRTGLRSGLPSGSIEAALGRSTTDRKKIAVRREGKHAVTEYAVLEEFTYLSLVRLKLRTGRTHQIRVHLHHVGHPVFGDPTYGGRRIAWGSTDKKRKDEVQKILALIDRQALHAKTLGFIHPGTGEHMKFDSPLPADMEAVLACLQANLRGGA